MNLVFNKRIPPVNFNFSTFTCHCIDIAGRTHLLFTPKVKAVKYLGPLELLTE